MSLKSSQTHLTSSASGLLGSAAGSLRFFLPPLVHTDHPFLQLCPYFLQVLYQMLFLIEVYPVHPAYSIFLDFLPLLDCFRSLTEPLFQYAFDLQLLFSVSIK